MRRRNSPASGPVVHLPMGNYKVGKTLVIPAGCDLQLVGDSAGETGTRLNWTGAAGWGGAPRRRAQPCDAARLLHSRRAAPGPCVVENCDQPRGRIFADQLNANGPSAKGSTNAAALRISGLDHTDVLLRCSARQRQRRAVGGSAGRRRGEPGDQPGEHLHRAPRVRRRANTTCARADDWSCGASITSAAAIR